jgi:hypothetical protein
MLFSKAKFVSFAVEVIDGYLFSEETGKDRAFRSAPAFRRSLAEESYETDIDSDPRMENFVTIFKSLFVLLVIIGLLFTIVHTHVRSSLLSGMDRVKCVDSKDKLVGTLRMTSGDATHDQLYLPTKTIDESTSEPFVGADVESGTTHSTYWAMVVV